MTTANIWGSVAAHRKRALAGALLLLVLGVTVWMVFSVLLCPSGMTEFNVRFRVRTGMTLGEVEAILGPGEPIKSSQVPLDYYNGPVVRGDTFYAWHPKDGTEAVIGFKDRKVYEKWFWAPSL